jgi:hypothetical protein
MGTEDARNMSSFMKKFWIFDASSCFFYSKGLGLCNLREEYLRFKSTYPEIWVGFLKYGTQHPQTSSWQVQVDHNVSICRAHRNVKLILA